MACIRESASVIKVGGSQGLQALKHFVRLMLLRARASYSRESLSLRISLFLTHPLRHQRGPILKINSTRVIQCPRFTPKYKTAQTKARSGTRASGHVARPFAIDKLLGSLNHKMHPMVMPIGH